MSYSYCEYRPYLLVADDDQWSGLMQSCGAEATVFIVEDEPSIQLGLAVVLKTVGLSVKPFVSAEAFLEGYRPTPNSCLILDVQLPGMSGIELQWKLANAADSLPIILMSAGASTIRKEELSDDVKAILEKPFDPAELFELIERYC